MPFPQPTFVFHFTRVEHLASIIVAGLRCDREAQDAGVLQIEVGNRGIKADRRTTPVPVEPGGMVADYAPFYFGPRSPMMYSIAKNNVPGYDEGTDRLIYLVTTLENLYGAGHDLVLTDRNARLATAAFHRLRDGIPEEGFIDWELMKAKYWGDYVDGRERRMAECLAPGAVAWPLFTDVVAKSQVVAAEVRATIAQAMQASRAGGADPGSPAIHVRPDWYF